MKVYLFDGDLIVNLEEVVTASIVYKYDGCYLYAIEILLKNGIRISTRYYRNENKMKEILEEIFKKMLDNWLLMCYNKYIKSREK